MGSREPLPPNVRMENSGPGTQPIHEGTGDQVVMAGNGTQNIIRKQTIFNLTGVSLSHVAQLTLDGADQCNEPSRRNIIDWLLLQSDLDPLQDHEQLLGQVAPGTGGWVLQRDEILDWKNPLSTTRFLWMSGVLGSGKSTLASMIVRSLELESEGADGIACIYIYFQSGAEHQASFTSILICLLRQLFQRRQSIELLEALRSMCKDWWELHKPPRSEAFVQLFRDGLATFQTVYLVLDALDNCQNSPVEPTRDRLHEEIRTLPPNVMILVTSRDGWQVGRDLGADRELRITPQRSDVENYVRSRIKNHDILRREVARSDGIRFEQSIVGVVTRAALSSSMFLLARVQMDTVCEQGTLHHVKQALHQLPKSVTTAFKASVEQIKRMAGVRNKRSGYLLARHVLTWVTHARRPLTVDQLRHSYAVQVDDTYFSADCLPDELDLLSVCAGLVVVNPSTRTVGLIHESAEAYVRDHRLVYEQADLMMAKICLRYLLFDGSTEGRECDRPLSQYAASYWMAHLGPEEEADAEAEDLAIRFLKDSAKVQTAFRSMTGSTCPAFDGISGLHASVYLDRPRLIERLLDSEGLDVNAAAADGQTALHWAAHHGRSAAARVLTKRTADPDRQDRHKDTPLHIALLSAGEVSEDVVQALVDARPRMDIPGQRGHTALGWAVKHATLSVAKILLRGLEDVNAEITPGFPALREVMQERGGNELHELVDILLAKGTDPNWQSTSTDWTPLKGAVEREDPELVVQLLGKKARVNLRGHDSGYTALREGVCYSRQSMVQLLIEHGADVKDRFDDGSTPLTTAISVDNEAIMRMLLQHGAPVNEKLINGSTPLIEAVKRNAPGLVWMLLESGAFPDERDDEGSTALHHATKRAKSAGGASLWLLLRTGPNVELRDNDRLSPLDWAVEMNDLSAAWLLCEHGADPDADDDVGGLTALCRASGLGHRELVRFLLDRGATADRVDNAGHAALHHAAWKGHGEVVELLASRGATVDSRDAEGKTALVIAARTGALDMLRVLLQHGASTDIGNTDGMNALHFAASYKFNDGLRLLLEKTTDPNLPDRKGTAPLHWAAYHGDAETIRVLAAGGADIDARTNKTHMTPLMLAVMGRRNDVVLALLEAKAKMELRDTQGVTAREHAVRLGHDDIVKILDGFAAGKT